MMIVIVIISIPGFLKNYKCHVYDYDYDLLV